jgi:hypothetical protein
MLIFIVTIVCLGLMIVFWVAGRNSPRPNLREIRAFARLRRALGMSVEAGTRLHVSVGSGGLQDLPAGAGFIGLAVLERVTRMASVSDRPPMTTAGDPGLAILSGDSMNSALRSMGNEAQFEPTNARLTGLTPFSFAAGAMPVISDEQVAANVLTGHFGGEVALLTEAGERKNSLVIAGSDDLPGQAVLYAAAEEPLIGEELYASGAYLGSGPMHIASLRAQDVLRWILIAGLLGLAVARLVGVL